MWKVKEQLWALLRTDSLTDAAAAKEEPQVLVAAGARPETNKLHHTVCRWWNEIEVLIVTGATTGRKKPTAAPGHATAGALPHERRR